jgi:hypothetical protein
MNIFKLFKKKKEEILQTDKILSDYIDHCDIHLNKNIMYFYKKYFFDAFIIDRSLKCGILCRKFLLERYSTFSIYDYIKRTRSDGIVLNCDQFKDIKIIPYDIIYKQLITDKEIIDESNNLYMRIDSLCIRNTHHCGKCYHWLSINGTHDSIPDVLNSLNRDHRYCKLTLDNLSPLM